MTIENVDENVEILNIATKNFYDEQKSKIMATPMI